MFRKILVANRGEIAVRVVRACRDLGVASVAVYSDVDRAALHVRLADEAYPCGPARATESYLDVSRLLEIARRAGADALHPGYGFLSENAELAEACARAGVVFVGPAPSVIRSMGDKLTSRALMRDAGVPVVPGSPALTTDDEVLASARQLGMPLVVKASGGGGGRGMRIVREEKELLPAVARARSEAASAFGSDTVYLEGYVDGPRHVEVQLLADGHGNVLHLYERECSIQRRHQKLVEEAPANIDDAQRAALGEAAVRAARAVDYTGAGTVEFLMDSSGRAHFLEMNTRVQVEHPVTEAITGVDIVTEMIRVAAGEPLRWSQDDVRIRGHAIEARVYAEDPAKGFLPSPGVLETFRPPAGVGIRVDAGVQQGDAVTPHYDALLAKVIASAASRGQAIARLDRALAEFRVAGVATTIPFHRRVLAHEQFVAARYDTGFVDDCMGGGKLAAGTGDADALRAAVALLALSRVRGRDGASIAIERKGDPGGRFTAAVAPVGDGDEPGRRVVSIDGEALAVDAVVSGGAAWSLILGGAQREGSVVEKRAGRFEVRIGDDAFVLQVVDEDA